MNNQPQATAPEHTPSHTSDIAPLDPALFEALCALQEDGTQHSTLQSSPLALLAEWLNGLTGDGLVLWRQGSNWLWCWQGTGLVAEIDRLGLGDAVADAVAARYDPAQPMIKPMIKRQAKPTNTCGRDVHC